MIVKGPYVHEKKTANALDGGIRRIRICRATG
jgi:hypothetical protein